MTRFRLLIDEPPDDWREDVMAVAIACVAIVIVALFAGLGGPAA